MLILIVERDRATALSMELMLRSEGDSVQLADNGDDAIAMAKDFDFDAITLGLSLPDMTGFEVLRSIRVAKVKSAVIVVSGFTDIESKVRALGHGADDYLTKPFHKDELVARIHAIVRRSGGHPSSVVSVGDLAIDLGEKRASIAGRAVHLTGKEWQVLELLAMRKGRVVTKVQFLQHLYSGMDEPEIKIIDVFICKLRARLSVVAGDRQFIDTAWGVGWSLNDPDACGPIPQHKPAGITRAMIAEGKAHAVGLAAVEGELGGDLGAAAQ